MYMGGGGGVGCIILVFQHFCYLIPLFRFFCPVHPDHPSLGMGPTNLNVLAMGGCSTRRGSGFLALVQIFEKKKDLNLSAI